MLLRWIRRHLIRRRPFPPAWRILLHRTMRFWEGLTADEQARIEDEIRFFIAERHWEGCGGLVLTEEMRVIIAAQACRLLLGRPGERYANVTAVLVYPSGYFTGPQPTPVMAAARRGSRPAAARPCSGRPSSTGR